MGFNAIKFLYKETKGMAKIVTTQYRENYGAHDWDGTGECPQYWKNKFGSTIVVLGAKSDDQVHEVINHSSNYSHEYIIDMRDVSQNYVNNVGKEASIVYEPWEERHYITIAEDGSILEERVSGFENLRQGLKQYTHRWEYANAEDRHSGNSSNYEVEYRFKNGMVANSEKEALEIFEHLNNRARA